MYTDEDLDLAVEKQIFSETSVLKFRDYFRTTKNATIDDKENFRLATGFNDVFVVIACILLLYSSYSVLGAINELSSIVSLPLLSWGLAEFFVRKCKMALPGIVLLFAFVGGAFALSMHFLPVTSKASYITASALSGIAAFIHYLRFQIPITIAACAAAAAGFLAAIIIYFFPGTITHIPVMLLVGGICIFMFAMSWDFSDRTRTTHRSDVGFWLHLLSAPLIVHPVFVSLGIQEGNASLSSIIIIILLYILMSIVSIIINRLAFMVSSLLYIIYALSNLFSLYGIVGYNLAITGVCIGGGLLLLSAFWHSVRSVILRILPMPILKLVPEAH
ncbi:MAG: hypothetical protein QS748_00845 [Candidatus Endonucleobacter bathymodioli]|uniref:Uncharacterized protein n=1 Tax=Candidatus Endonucleibacter bathymodioli TaxID=539814 RepID=A0AA90SRZ8_9GAMM|nr:hypothetical protein [Candidatus Endonucleobacter bathymodioli]